MIRGQVLASGLVSLLFEGMAPRSMPVDDKERAPMGPLPAQSIGTSATHAAMEAAIVGTMPIALGLGAGAESRRPLGIIVVGGLAFSQLVTLYLTPVLYTYFDALQERTRHRHRELVVLVPTPLPAGD